VIVHCFAPWPLRPKKTEKSSVDSGLSRGDLLRAVAVDAAGRPVQRHQLEEINVDYGAFKLLQALLFFGSAMGFCLWQLAAIRRLRRERESARQRDAHS